jgi:hypothetical protein
MNLQQLFQTNNWLSIEITLIKLYPNQTEVIEQYKSVFETIQNQEPHPNEMQIVLKEYPSDSFEDEENNSSYIDVSGRKNEQNTDLHSISYAIEYERWENWLGMNLAPETLSNFTELEIISHCLYEMTYFGFQQNEIQESLTSLKNTIDEFKNQSEEEKKANTITLEELKQKHFNKNS